MEWFKFDGNILGLEECPKCHVKIQKIKDFDINLNSLTRKSRIKMFDVIYNSEHILGLHNGFDILDAELLFELIKKLTSKKKTELFLYFEDENNSKIIDFVNNHWEYEKSSLWRETFKRLTKKNQNDFILENFPNCPNIGFCYDSGHHNAYTPNEQPLDKYGSMLVTTHIHDNEGPSGTPQDQHHIMGEGNINYDAVFAKLKKYNVPRLNLESYCNETSIYFNKISVEEFLEKSYRRLTEQMQKSGIEFR